MFMTKDPKKVETQQPGCEETVEEIDIRLRFEAGRSTDQDMLRLMEKLEQKDTPTDRARRKRDEQ
jgi:hypothetical protein